MNHDDKNSSVNKIVIKKSAILVFTMLVSTLLFLALIILPMAASSSAFAGSKEYKLPNKVPVPVDNKLNTARIELGKKLFFDPRLSGSNWISCATCHNPALGWSDGLKTAIGNGQQVLGRHTPTIINSAYSKLQFWDGRANTLEEQALGPIQAAGEMNQNLDELVKELNAIPGYKPLFEKAYPGEGISKSTIAKAISSFERTIVSKNSPFDQYVSGNKNALSKAELRGFELFEGKARCASCHSGFNFSDSSFYNIGISDSNDPGRFAIEKNNKMMGAMKTPTLRDVALTSPYMHNGQYTSLEEVVDHYDRGGDSSDGKSPLMDKLNLSKQEKSDLVAFLKSLTGKTPKVTIPQLPN